MESSSENHEEILNFDMHTKIRPYQFEPLATNTRNTEIESTSSSESDSESETHAATADIRTVNEWCSCGGCSDMPSDRENICCLSLPRVQDILSVTTHTCITEHIGFHGNCLNPFVLEASVYDFVEDEGLFGDDEPLNEIMRYIAYRRFTRWVHGRLGRKNRRIIPACAVLCIRKKFPSDYYHGFRFPIY